MTLMKATCTVYDQCAVTQVNTCTYALSVLNILLHAGQKRSSSTDSSPLPAQSIIMLHINTALAIKQAIIC